MAPVNLWFHSLFSEIELYLNGELISSTNHTYPYRPYIENLLSYGTEAKTTQLATELYYKDEGEKMEDFDPTNAGSNEGLKERAYFVSGGKIAHMIGRPHLDFFHQNRYLLNNVDVWLKLYPSKSEFNLMAAANYATVITKAQLYVKMVDLNPELSNSIGRSLLKTSCKYPIKRTVVKTFSIPQGTQDMQHDNVFQGQTPQKLTLALVENESFNGGFKRNPWNFKDFGTNYLAVTVNGKQFPATPLQPNFEEGDYMRSYMTLFEAHGTKHANVGNDISREEYASGYTIWSFHLGAEMCDSHRVDLTEEGHLKIDIRFKEPLKKAVNVIVFGEFDNIIEIDHSRRVVKDY